MALAPEQPTLGVQAHISDRTISARDLARHVVDRNLASLFLCEHTHIPVQSESTSPRGFLPEWTKRIPDPYISLAAVAATTDLEIGTAVALAAQHDPIVLAKQIATLDRLCLGRFVFGVGWGWNREEYTNHTRQPPNTRVAALRETVELMRRIWSDEIAEYSGSHLSLTPSWSWPKPTMAGGPPVLIGAAASDRNFDRIVDWADGWIPMDLATFDDDFAAALSDLRGRWKKAGRDPATLDVTVLRDHRSSNDFARDLERATELGIRRVLVLLWEESMADAEAILDEIVRGVDLVG
jgi:probable F420-dependent oxidoreductase